MRLRIILAGVALIILAAVYVSTQELSAPAQPVSQELPRETFIQAE